MTLPKISIVTPSYNQGPFIEKTICSVLDQNYANLEYIIIDGGSTDETVGIIKKYEKHLAFWVSEKDSGQSAAINKGLAHATGDIFNWLNSDDYLEPQALATVGAYFLEHPETNVYAGKCRLFGDFFASTIRQLGIKNTPEESILTYEMNQPSTFYRAGNTIREFGGVNETLHYCMDLELWFRYLCQYGHQGIHFSNHLLSHFRMHETSKTETSNAGFLADEQQLIYFIAAHLGLPEVILDYLRPDEVYYQPIRDWCFDGVGRSRFYLALSKKKLWDAFLRGHKSAARQMYTRLLAGLGMPMNRPHLGMGYHLFLK